tara:strand:- start:84 stop:275 length:192 start_codon:yes stop_codon:yes gene_type:complete
MLDWKVLPSPKPSWESFKMMMPQFDNNPTKVLWTWRKMKLSTEEFKRLKSLEEKAARKWAFMF